MKEPIIINTDGDISFYESLSTAERNLEPPNVLNNIHVIYDSEGLLLIPVVIDDPVYDVVKIYASDTDRPAELIEILIDFFSEIGHDPLILNTMTLKELVELGMRYKITL